MNMVATALKSLETATIGNGQIFALLQQLSAELLANESATAVLEKWCVDLAIAEVATIIAHPIDGPIRAPSDETRARLKVGDDTAITYRNVALMCGDITLSVAQNWYVPERLTPEMNAVLASSEIPFGKVIAPLNPTRETLNTIFLWAPSDIIPQNLLEQSAILSSGDGLPIAAVIETYQRGVFGV